jgi:tetratricopeptide (TPR) repeat protein
MSKYKDQQRQQIEEERRLVRRRRWLAVIGSVLVLAAGVAIWHRDTNTSKANAAFSQKPADEKWNLAALLALTPFQLGELDVGLVNLLCAEGLRGSENLDLAKSLGRLDEMAKRVGSETDRNMRQFRSKPAEFRNSKAYFRMVVLATVLQQDFGIRYSPNRASPVGKGETDDKFYADSHDVFLHGLTGEMKSGTCCSLPVLYVAVGRRLKYPLSLVAAKCHLFVRWEDRETRFNIEATAGGMTSHDDDHYRKWPYPMTAGEEKDMGFIKSMSVGEECANFLATRGHCLRAAGRYDEALTAYEQAVRVAPDARFYGCLLATAKRGNPTRPGPFSPGIGMPPDPALQNDPPEIAWGLWRVDEELRRRGLLPRQPPAASKGLPPGQPVEAEDSGLPPTKQTGNSQAEKEIK